MMRTRIPAFTIAVVFAVAIAIARARTTWDVFSSRRRAALVAGGTALLLAVGLVGKASAQPQGAPTDLQRPSAIDAGAPGHWDLPRLFYEPRQRRSLDTQERAARLGLNSSAAPSGPRFDGWVSGPNGTHAWVNGNRYSTDRAGRLHAAGTSAVDGESDEVVSGRAQLDRAHGLLTVQRDSEGAVRLRVGEADGAIGRVDNDADGSVNRGGGGATTAGGTGPRP